MSFDAATLKRLAEAGLDPARLPVHVAIIMDGNGRWAKDRGWPRVKGHEAGARTVRKVIESAPGLGIRFLTLYAFSSDNWQRPAAEVATLMRLFVTYLHEEAERCVQNGVRLSVIGRRDRLGPEVALGIAATERRTEPGRVLHLQLAIDYSARDGLVRALPLVDGAPSRQALARAIALANHADPAVPPVDLLIRTGKEQRLSDFLLWELAYAELHFSSLMWPDFSVEDFGAAVQAFRGRERRFGRVP